MGGRALLGVFDGWVKYETCIYVSLCVCVCCEKLVSETFRNNLCVSYSFFIGYENICTDLAPRSC